MVVMSEVQDTQFELSTEHCGAVFFESVKLIFWVPLTYAPDNGEIILTLGIVVSLVAVFEPEPVLPAVSVCVAVAVSVPSARPERSSPLAVQFPDEQAGVAFTVSASTPSVIAKDTFPESTLSQRPERVIEVLLVSFTGGKVITVTVGGIVSLFAVFKSLPMLPLRSV